jgi:hypothetical protein
MHQCAQFLFTRRMFGVFALLAITAAPAHAAGALEGTWGGAGAGGVSAQVIVTGRDVIGLYWGGDYTDATHVRVSSDGADLKFDFAGGAAELKRAGSGAALTVHDRNGVAKLSLKRD